MKRKYNKIFISNTKLQVGTNFEEDVFLRFTNEVEITDLVCSREALRGLQLSIEDYLEKSELNKEVVH